MFSLVIYFIPSINSIYVSIPISQFLPPPPFPLGIHTFVLYVCVYFFFLFFFFNSYFIYLFILFLFLAVLGLRFVRGLSLVAASGGRFSSRCGGHSSSRCAGLSLSLPLPLRGTGSRRASSTAVAHGPSCSAACGIFPDQGSNPCPLH